MPSQHNHFIHLLAYNTPSLPLTHQVARSLVPVIVMAISMFYYGKNPPQTLIITTTLTATFTLLPSPTRSLTISSSSSYHALLYFLIHHRQVFQFSA